MQIHPDLTDWRMCAIARMRSFSTRIPRGIEYPINEIRLLLTRCDLDHTDQFAKWGSIPLNGCMLDVAGRNEGYRISRPAETKE